MEYFYGGGGNSNPDFIYRFEVKDVTNEMWAWCESYPLTGPFERWHIQRKRVSSKVEVEYTLITFESRKAALMFSIAFSEYILEDKTYSFARSIHEPFN
jgi:hypothetical protein